MDHRDLCHLTLVAVLVRKDAPVGKRFCACLLPEQLGVLHPGSNLDLVLVSLCLQKAKKYVEGREKKESVRQESTGGKERREERGERTGQGE